MKLFDVPILGKDSEMRLLMLARFIWHHLSNLSAFKSTTADVGIHDENLSFSKIFTRICEILHDNREY
jgi:hypothetical protein